MIKLGTIGMFNTAKNNPITIADGETINGYIFTIGSDGKADAPVAGDSTDKQTDDLYVALNVITGDGDYDAGTKIKSGYPLNGYLIKAWEGQTLEVNEGSITYAKGDDYSDIVAKTTVMVAGTDGKLTIADGTTIKAEDYNITFKVTEKFQLDGNAVKVEIAVA